MKMGGSRKVLHEYEKEKITLDDLADIIMEVEIENEIHIARLLLENMKNEITEQQYDDLDYVLSKREVRFGL